MHGIKKHHFPLQEVCHYHKSLIRGIHHRQYYHYISLYINSTKGSPDNKIRFQDLPVITRNYSAAFAVFPFLYIEVILKRACISVSSCKFSVSSWRPFENASWAVWSGERMVPIMCFFKRLSCFPRVWPSFTALSLQELGAVRSTGIKFGSLTSVKWYDGKIRLFLFFSHLHIDNWLKSREKLRLIRIEIHRKDITFRFENTLGKGFWFFS